MQRHLFPILWLRWTTWWKYDLNLLKILGDLRLRELAWTPSLPLKGWLLSWRCLHLSALATKMECLLRLACPPTPLFAHDISYSFTINDKPATSCTSSFLLSFCIHSICSPLFLCPTLFLIASGNDIHSLLLIWYLSSFSLGVIFSGVPNHMRFECIWLFSFNSYLFPSYFFFFCLLSLSLSLSGLLFDFFYNAFNSLSSIYPLYFVDYLRKCISFWLD